MRPVRRDAIAGPASLLSADGAGASELKRAITHYGPPAKKTKFAFRAYKSDDVRHTLEALFHGKCAYCESRYDVSGPVDIEHFRPKGGIDGVDGHPGYWWLAADWANLLPSCLDCNRRRYQPTPKAFASLSGGLDASREKGFAAIKTGKETCFPIAAAGVRMTGRPAPDVAASALTAEQALLLDPCRDQPGEHLRFYIDREEPLGLVYPSGTADVALPILPAPTNRVEQIEKAARDAGVSVRGAVSIQVYGLNRLALVQERTRLLRKLEFLGAIVLELSSVADSLEGMNVAAADEPVRIYAIQRARAAASRAISEIRSMADPKAPFSTMVRAWIEAFKAEAGAPAPPPPPTAPAGWQRRAINLG